MIKLLPVIFLLSINIFVADNEISIDQTGATANLDIEQLGSGNLIGGSTATAGSMTALDLDGATMTLDINQLGNSNLFRGDIYADSYTGFFEFTGDSNTFAMQTDPDNTYGADSSNVNVNVSAYEPAIDIWSSTVLSNVTSTFNAKLVGELCSLLTVKIFAGEAGSINAEVAIASVESTPVPWVPIASNDKLNGMSCSPSAVEAGDNTPPSWLATVSVNPSIVLLMTLIAAMLIPPES